MSTWRGVPAEVVATRYPSLVAYGVLLTANRADAEDLVQDALVKVFSRIRPFPNVAAADQYVRRAMLTIYLDGARRDGLWRRIRGAVVSDEAVAGPEHLVATGTDLRAALARLSPRERTCVVLRHFDDMTVAQIAAEVGLAEGSVKRYLSDAMAKLGAELAPSAETGAGADERADVVVHRATRRN